MIAARALHGIALAPRARQSTPRGATSTRKPQSPARAALVDGRSNFLGLDPSEGIWGFKPFSELLIGRLAMLGFGAGLTKEVVTGQPILHQIGVDSPSLPVFEILLALLGGAIVVSAVDTFHRFATNTMPETDAQRYAYFVANPLGEDEDAVIPPAGEAAGASSTGGEGAAPLPTPQWITDREIAALHAENARALEISNGRWAMLGFVSAIVVEAATGNGVIAQALFYAKALGLVSSSAS